MSEPGGEKTECTAPLSATRAKPPPACPGSPSTAAATSLSVNPGRTSTGYTFGPAARMARTWPKVWFWCKA